MTPKPPDSQLCREATELVREASPEHLFNHCLRSWQFAAILADQGNIAHDAEVLYLGTIMHDMGLVTGLEDPIRFEVTGANHARSELTARGLEPARAEIIWDLIALHTTVGIAEHKGPEVTLGHMGISVDVVGRWADELAPEQIAEIMELTPRAGFVEEFPRLVAQHVSANPHVALFNFMHSVAGRHCAGYGAPEFEDLLGGNPIDR